MAPGLDNMLKRYCTVPLLILICSSSPISAQNHSTHGIPDFCSANETTVIQQLPGFEYRGCYADEQYSRLLRIGANGTDSMSVKTCASLCSISGYAFFGVEFSYQCWCDNVLNPRAVPTDQSNCNYACCADSSVACGGFDFIGIYEAIGPLPTQAANATDNIGPSPMQTPTVTNNSGNPSDNATQDGGKNSSNTINDGGNNSQTSNNIALGTGIGIGVPGLILSAVLVKMKFSKRGRNPRQGTCQPSTKASSIRSGDTESISPV